MGGKGKNAQSENLLFCTDRIEGGEGNGTRKEEDCIYNGNYSLRKITLSI